MKVNENILRKWSNRFAKIPSENKERLTLQLILILIAVVTNDDLVKMENFLDGAFKPFEDVK